MQMQTSEYIAGAFMDWEVSRVKELNWPAYVSHLLNK